jgi:uncharacterized DUF497 family protein
VLLKVHEIIWLDDIVDKLRRKHGVETYEVVELFRQSPYIRFMEKGHRKGEDLYLALGQTDSGRYLSVFFVVKPGKRALVVSARGMTPRERKRYEQR